MNQSVLNKVKILSTIKSAAQNKHTVILQYSDAKNKLSSREVEPYEFNGNKLWAHCLLRDNIRQFDISRIKSAEETENTFEPRRDIKIS
jgi:predicted DNA-binding transcriptional regulator YafY